MFAIWDYCARSSARVVLRSDAAGIGGGSLAFTTNGTQLGALHLAAEHAQHELDEMLAGVGLFADGGHQALRAAAGDSRTVPSERDLFRPCPEGLGHSTLETAFQLTHLLGGQSGAGPAEQR